MSILPATEIAGKSTTAMENLDKRKELQFLDSPRCIEAGKWEKIKATGSRPCPRRHHSMTCISSVRCRQRLLTGESLLEDNGALVTVDRVLFFGGQGEGIPFEAFNDLYLLLIDRSSHLKRDTMAKTLARWIALTPTGQAPSHRCGHSATFLSHRLLLVCGGSNGTAPINTLEAFLLHIEEDEGYGTFRWSNPVAINAPSGRTMHSVHRVTKNEVLIFGGRQILQSNGLLDVYRLQLEGMAALDQNKHIATWTQPNISGTIPNMRRGHSTTAIGHNLLLIGGQDELTGELRNDTLVLHVPTLCWRIPKILGTPPCPRRGFKTQYFGTSLVISSGFVANDTNSKVDQLVPESDIHVLTMQ